MKKMHFLLLMFIALSVSCSDDKVEQYQTVSFAVQLNYPSASGVTPVADVSVQATAGSGVVYSSKTDENGRAEFDLPVGLYELSATDKRKETGKTKVFTGVSTNVAVSETMTKTITLSLTETEVGQIVIKEIYNGGCQKDDGSGVYHFDKYVILYNNSDEPAELQNMCLAIVLPYNSNITNSDYSNGSLIYESEGWIPAGLGYFYFANATTLNPGEQAVVALNNANNNTLTYSNSVDLSKSDYYVTYAPEVFNNTSYHPAPSASISTSHYLPGFKYGTGNAWAVSNTSPAVFLFAPNGTSPEAFNADASNISLYGGSSTQVRKKVPVSWVIDGVEVFRYGASNNTKRFTSSVDAGYVNLTAGYGYTLYRNVDKEATEAIAENSGKLVYNYSSGTVADNGTTDPSGIDAEASAKQGARIIYMDTNNSTNDFHQRVRSSLKN